MGAVIEVKYFNTFILNKTNNGSEMPIWNGSRGIPKDLGGYDVVSGTVDANNWVIEESRIRGGYNNTSVDFGAKAYIVEEDTDASFLGNSLIYSGPFNSRTGINKTNVFSVGEDITKSADPANGSIQKLFAADSNLNVFQELKVSRALIDKDAIYSAEGGGSVTSSNLVIGVLQPYAGEYGISKNPESFAQYGYNQYFADKNNNVILELNRSGITEISAFGMKNFFRTSLESIDNSISEGYVTAGFDIHNKQYVASLRGNPVFNFNENNYFTLSYDSKYNGWVSFYSYQPEQMFSLKDNFYSVKGGKLFEHYSELVSRGSFYGTSYPSTINFIVNDNPVKSKSFLTIAYEGSNGWRVEKAGVTSDPTGSNFSTSSQTWIETFDSSAIVPSYYEGEYTVVQSNAIANAASVNTTVVIQNLTGTYGSNNQVIIPVNSTVTGEGVLIGTRVVSYNSTTGALVVNQNLNIIKHAQLSFSRFVNRGSYNTVFGTPNPSFINKYYEGFNRKENKYVASLINNSRVSAGEVNFAEQIAGIKGFYATVSMSTDTTTDPGGEKQLFQVSTTYTQNNGF
jgi:hypothetical protein|tara:strand:+ start:5407 stop:7113 length:1707 start_codon:yes stop_codon:yes gene_type:complete